MARLRLVLIHGLALALFSADRFSWGASPATASWGPMKEIEASARSEGKLVFYVGAGFTTREAERAAGQFFRDRYGVSLEWTSFPGIEVPTRVIAEARTHPVADLVLIGFSGRYLPLKERGLVVPILAPSTLEKEVWRLDPAYVTPEDRDYLYYKIPLSPSLLVHTKLVSQAEEPKSYQDLLHPRWRGKIIFMTPAIGGSGSGWFDAAYRTLGPDYMRGLAKQVVLTQNNQEPPDALARGQYAIALAPNLPRALALIEQGAPLKFLHPKEGSHLSESGISMVRNAPHLNAAKLFLQWFFTKEGQTLFARSLPAISVRKDVAQDYLPDGMRYVEGAPLLAKDVKDMRIPENAAELRALAKQIFGEKK